MLIELLVGKDQAKILDLVLPTREIPQDSSPAPPPRRVPSKTEFAFRGSGRRSRLRRRRWR